MPVLYSDRAVPLAIKASNPLAVAVDLAYDFTQHDTAHANGVPWIHVGATAPTLVISGTMSLTTANGEPGRLAASGSVYDYTNLTNYGLQVGTGDFTIGLRMTIPAAIATADGAIELMRISGSAGTLISISKAESATLGVYFSISGTLGFGAVQTAIFYPVNTTVMAWLTRFSGQTSFYTQNVTAGTDVVARTLPAASAIDLDATRAARLMLNFRGSGVQNTTPLVAFTHWSTGFSAADLSAIGKDFYDTQVNAAVADAITLDVPANDAVLASSFVASGTYAGAVPSSVQIQHGSGAWTTGTSATIGAGAWSATFTLGSASANTLQVRNGGNTAIVSNVRTGVVIASDSLTFTAPSPQQSAKDFRTFQMDGLGQAIVRVSGSFTVATTGLEWRWGVGAWTDWVGSLAGNTFDGMITLTGPDQRDLTVRLKDNPSVFATLLNVGVEDDWMVAGQSNHVGGGAGTYVPAEAPAGHPAWVASIYDKTGRWRINVETATDPFSKTTNATAYPAASAVYPVQAQSATAYNSYFGRLATRFMATGRCPAFVPCALGSTAIAAWAPTTNTAQLYGALVAVTNTIGAHKGILWWQGEADCGNGSTRAGHTAALNAIVNDWATRFGTKFIIMNINQTGTSAGTGGTGPTDTGFNAIHAAIEEVALTNPNVSGYADMNGAFSSSIHYATAPEIAEVSLRAFGAMTALPSLSAENGSTPWRGNEGSLAQAGALTGENGSTGLRGNEGSLLQTIALTGENGRLAWRGVEGSLPLVVTLAGENGRLAWRGSEAGLVPQGGLGDVCDTRAVSACQGPAGYGCTDLVNFYTGRDNVSYFKLYANLLEIDYSLVSGVDVEGAGGGVTAVVQSDRIVLSLSEPPPSAGVYSIRLIVRAVDHANGIVWGCPIKIRVHQMTGPAPTPAPVFLTQPSITGTSQVGQVLTAVDGTASNTTTMTRKWYMDDAEIVGETGASYTLIAGDVGKVPGLRNFATGPGGGPVQSSLASAAEVIAAPLGVRSVVVGDSMTQRTWDSAPGGATLSASGGVATLTLATARENILPGTLIRIVNSARPDSFFAGEWPIATKPSGSSITFNYTGGATASAEGNWTIAYGNAVASESYVNHIQARLRQRLNIVKNLGVDGEVTAQILSRMQTKVAPYSPDILIVMAGTNDFNTGVPIATTTANWYAILDLAVTQASLVVAICPPPRSTASADPGTLAAQIKAYAAANHPTKVLVIDGYALTVGSGVTSAKAGNLIDAVHLSPNGARDIGVPTADALNALIPATPAVPVPPNFVPNGNFAAVTGNLANGVTLVTAASHTLTPSIVAEPGGNGNLQRLQIVATSTPGVSRMVVGSIHAALVPGDRYRLWARARIESTTGGMPTFNTDLNIVAGGLTYNHRALTTATGSAMGGTAQAYQGTLDAYVRSEVFVCPANLTECSPRLTIGTSSAGTSVVSFGEVDVEKVN